MKLLVIDDNRFDRAIMIVWTVQKSNVNDQCWKGDEILERGKYNLIV
jgi:hypothetical protein